MKNRLLYLDCSMGAAGDMLAGALIELLAEPEQFVEEFNALGIPEVTMELAKTQKCGITGTKVRMLIQGREEHEYYRAHRHSHSHEHNHSHDHGPLEHDHESEHHHGNEHDHEHEHHYDHEHHSHTHDHAHDDHHHSHDHVSDHMHGTDHEHDHEHGHDHDHHHSHDHSHTGMAEIREILESLPVSEKVRHDALEVYGLIAEAESKAHDKPSMQIHFHEVGTLDAVADVTAVCMLMEKLSPNRVIASPVHVGSGQVHCAHGILPVPAPATAHILQGVPIYGGNIQGELCTPTGAALLKYYADEFGGMPVLTTERIGYGMGTKDFTAANCLRAFMGVLNEEGNRAGLSVSAGAFSASNETVSAGAASAPDTTASAGTSLAPDETASAKDKISSACCTPADEQGMIQLECNIDDMTGEQMGFAMEEIMKAGAKEVFTTPVGMKKSRPGLQLTVICSETDRRKVIKSIFRHTTTIGMRETGISRYVLSRSLEKENTPFGPVTVKRSSGYGVEREKYEYEELAAIAREKNLSLQEVLEIIQRRDVGASRDIEGCPDIESSRDVGGSRS